MCEQRLRSGMARPFLVALLVMATAGMPKVNAGAPSTTSTVLAVSAGTVSAGTVTTLTSTTTFTASAPTVFTPGNAPLTRGQVTFCSSTAAQCDGAAVFGVAAVTGNGTASIKLRLGVGSYSIKAVFAALSGSGIKGSTSAPQLVQVNGAANYTTGTTIAATGSVGNYALVGTVTAFGTPTATGTVSFLDTSNGNATVASAVLDPTTLSRIFVPATGSPLSGPGAVEYVVAGDFNGDGITDLAVSNNNNNGAMAIYLGNGDGAFQAPTTYNSGGFPRSFAVADVNGDGKLDLLVPTQTNDSVGVLLGNGDGTFGAVTSYAVGNAPVFVTVGDFNRDGKLDLVVVNDSANSVSVLLGNGDGTFQTQVTYATGEFPEGVAVGDFNIDGKLDLAVSDSTGVSLLLGNGNGTFQAATTIAVGSGASPGFLVAGDLRGNGTLDLVYPDTGSPNVYVLLGINDGTFQSAVKYAVGDAPQAASVGDVNGDGILDLAVADTGADGLVSVLYGKGDGTFAAKTDYSVGNNPENVALADFNGDGLLDLATADVGPSTTTILLQQLGETATAAGVSAVGSGTHPVLANYPGDASHRSSMSATTPLLGSALPATTTQLGVAPNPSTFGQLVTMTATILPTPAGAPLGTVSFFSGTALLGTGTVNPSGVASFSAGGLSAGVNSITAVYSGNAAFGGSTSAALFENVHATATTSTTLALSAAMVTAGTATTLTATVNGVCAVVTSGSVIFCDASAAQCNDVAILGTVQLQSDGTAVLKRTFGVGTYSIKAVFAGRSDVAGSSSPAQSLTVNGNGLYPSVTTLSDAGAAGNYSLLGTVTAFGAKPLGGNLTFLDTSNSNAVIAMAEIAGGSPSYVLTSSAGSPLPGTNGPEDVVAADFNGDGILDLAVVNDSSPILSVYLGNGDGSFQAAVTYPLSGFGAAIAVGDFNDDGKLDVVVTSPGEFDTFSILLGNGDGTFQGEAIHGAGPTPVGVVVGDFNNDGVQDLAIAEVDGGLAVFLGKGDGTFNSATIYGSGNGAVYLASGDFNRDGLLDLAVAELNGDVAIYLGNGDGTFQAAVDYATGASSDYVVAADINKDGKLDLVVANGADTNMSVLLGNGDGTFQTQVLNATGDAPEELALGDFNRDGNLDIAATDDNDRTISIMYGNGDGTFQAPVIYDTTGSFPWGIVAGDFNGDGLTDLVETDQGPSTVTVYLNQQSATATATGLSVFGAGQHNVLASFPGDASRLPSQSPTVPLTGNPPAATAVTLVVAPNPAVAGQSVSFTATITPVPTGAPLGAVSFCSGALAGPAIASGWRREKGARSVGVGTRVAPEIPNEPCPSGTLLGTGTVSAAGVATFSTSALAAGTISLIGVYSGNFTFGGSTSVAVSEVVNGLTATTTTVSVAPNPAVAGQSVVLTATIAPVPTGSPLGTVEFYTGETQLGMGTVNALGVATFTTTGLAFGADSITAVYSGNALLGTSTSLALTVMITPGYSVMAMQTSFAVPEGGAVTIPLTVPPVGGAYTSMVTMSETGLPTGATGTFTPPVVTPGANGAPTTLTIQLKTLMARGTSFSPTERGMPLASRNFALMSLGLAFGLAGMLGLRLRRERAPRMTRLALAGMAYTGVVLLFAGCNGGASGTPITTKGSYTVTITGTSGALHPSITVTVLVQ
jgi:large repetitive protein